MSVLTGSFESRLIDGIKETLDRAEALSSTLQETLEKMTDDNIDQALYALTEQRDAARQRVFDLENAIAQACRAEPGQVRHILASALKKELPVYVENASVKALNELLKLLDDAVEVEYGYSRGVSREFAQKAWLILHSAGFQAPE